MNQTIKLIKALAEETRLRIISLLTNGELCVCDLMAVLELPQSTVSRHLAYLKNAGWVVGRRKGTWMYYRLSESGSNLHHDILQALEKHLHSMKEIVDDRNKLESYVRTKDKKSCSCVS